MMVTFISQCEKNALKKTRRVLDAFADRIGDNTWQAIITLEGLQAVRKLLRHSASKSTAVSCHWIRSRSRSELVWVVGNKDKFSGNGVVPVNKTKRVLLGNEWETGWTMATSIQILSTLAALLHDLGKANLGFQKKLLHPGTKQADPYRHEWISFRLFEAMIHGCDTDQQWLERLANFSEFTEQKPDWAASLSNDSKDKDKSRIGEKLPLARLLAWLIVSHHRLPFDSDNYNFRNWEVVRSHFRFPKLKLDKFYQRLAAWDGWVYSAKAFDERTDCADFWQFSAQASESRVWQKAIKRWANKALNHPPLMQLPKVNNPLIMHLSRLCLMVGDHNYSSLDAEDKNRVVGDKKLQQSLIANTCRKTKKPKQALDEHLLGVAEFTAKFSRLLPRFPEELRGLEDISPFAKRTPIERFQWQNRAWNLVNKHQKPAREQGFFGVNLASTGCGKTLGNARIMAALADPEKGPRFTIALGLRILTLQTGLALRDKLQLDDSALAILVGGAASKTLFELQQEESDKNNSERIWQESENYTDDFYGSESADPLITGQVDYEECALDQETLGTIVQDSKARQLIYAPIVSCTVDHIIGATETLRGGRHIAPMLRLMTSDLILDEPDDFDQNDLPALSRLVHMAGMLGSHVLLSSATLTPDMIAGLYAAYREGRKYWQINQGVESSDTYCFWFDEFNQQIETCGDPTAFETCHQKFIRKRVKQLESQPVRRAGEILPIELPKQIKGKKITNETSPYLFAEVANVLTEASHRLHQQHHEACATTGKTASVGVIRMANINPMYDLAQALYKQPMPDNVQIHLCCYHARQLLLLRSQLEQKLDRILNRNDYQSLFEHSEISEAVRNSEKQHHIFIVLATSVAEVGRDHDYDWAIVEPSSMRSIIQLVGRVWRHRPDKVATEPNVLILDNNINALKAGNNLGVGEAVFHSPGFEGDKHLLESHSCSELIPEEQLACINAIPRIAAPDKPAPAHRLADLEHAVMMDLLNNPKPNFVNGFWQENAAMQANAHAQLVSPFRFSHDLKEDFVVVMDDDHKSGMRFRYSDKAWEDPYGGESMNSMIHYSEFSPADASISPWLVTELPQALDYLSEKLDDDNQHLLAMRFTTVSLTKEKHWYFHPWFGFWPRK